MLFSQIITVIIVIAVGNVKDIGWKTLGKKLGINVVRRRSTRLLEKKRLGDPE